MCDNGRNDGICGVCWSGCGLRSGSGVFCPPGVRCSEWACLHGICDYGGAFWCLVVCGDAEGHGSDRDDGIHGDAGCLVKVVLVVFVWGGGVGEEVSFGGIFGLEPV